MRSERQIQAGNRLEELTIVAKDFTRRLREGTTDRQAAAMINYLRREMTRISRTIPCGPSTTKELTNAEELADSLIWQNIPNE